MDYFITGLVLALASAPFIWPPFVMIYRYFQAVEDQRYFRSQTAERASRPAA